MMFPKQNVMSYNKEMLSQDRLATKYKNISITLGITTGLLSISTGILGYFAYIYNCYGFF